MSQVTSKEIKKMDYVSFMGLLNETNRPPGGKDSMRRMAQNAFLTASSYVLHSGCNTGYCSFELCHLTKCKVVAIDVNDFMIASAQKKLAKEPLPYRDLMVFEKGNAKNLKFKDNTFDSVMSGGSTAFMDEKEKVVEEYARVCKPYGFVGDVVLYYHKSPPKDLISKMNKAMNTSIKKWSKEDWISLYTNAGLELYYLHDAKMNVFPTATDVKKYCEELVKQSTLDQKLHVVAIKKLYDYMILFNQNHQYLSYAVALFRKNPSREQVTLFGL
jgi:ubiquinone/menaquinone biosynthesis C-methylase UbiE